MNRFHPNLRRVQLLFLSLTIITPIFFIASLVFGSTEEFLAGLGVEIIGVWLTAGGVLGFEILFAVPDEDITDLKAKLEAQNVKIDELQHMLKQLLDDERDDKED